MMVDSSELVRVFFDYRQLLLLIFIMAASIMAAILFYGSKHYTVYAVVSVEDVCNKTGRFAGGEAYLLAEVARTVEFMQRLRGRLLRQPVGAGWVMRDGVVGGLKVEVLESGKGRRRQAYGVRVKGSFRSVEQGMAVVTEAAEELIGSGGGRLEGIVVEERVGAWRLARVGMVGIVIWVAVTLATDYILRVLK